VCGFFGIISENIDYSNKELDNISKSINHRGPDAHNSIKKKVGENYVYLDHNRLSIIDLSDQGTQPFISEDKNFILVFNGEIYNFQEIRKTLEKKKIKFKTKTDTEVLLNAWIEWREDCLNKFKGMFAFSIVDVKQQKIFLVRDNFGMKPIYFYQNKGKFFFASEIICILKLLREKINLNFDKIYDYLVYGNHDNTHETFFMNIFQLRPGEILSIDLNSNLIIKKKWWKPKTDLVENISFEKAKEKIKKDFLESVKKHLISDVKVGIALSGGIDSSAIACATKILDPKKEIILISFLPENKKDNESYWVKKIENHINTKSIKISQSEINLPSTVDEVIELQGEPFGDTTIIAEYLIFKEAKKNNIKVLLMGHGGDEVYVGYDGFPGAIIKSHLKNLKIINLLKFCFNWKKRNKATLFSLVKKISNEFFSGRIKSYLLNFTGIKEKPNWINRDFYKKRNISIGIKKKFNNYKSNRNLANKQLDNIYYQNLPAMLRYADRSSMKNSIECRLPFLNDNLFSYSLKLPENYLVSNKGVTKYIFKESMREIVPNKVLDREDKIGYFNNDDELINRMIKLTKLDNELEMFNLENLKKFLLNKNNNNLQKWRIINFMRWKNIFREYLHF